MSIYKVCTLPFHIGVAPGGSGGPWTPLFAWSFSLTRITRVSRKAVARVFQDSEINAFCYSIAILQTADVLALCDVINLRAGGQTAVQFKVPL